MRRVKDDEQYGQYDCTAFYGMIENEYIEKLKVSKCYVWETGDSYYDYEVVLEGYASYSIRGSYMGNGELTLDEVVYNYKSYRIDAGDYDFFEDVIAPIIIDYIEDAIMEEDFVSDDF